MTRPPLQLLSKEERLSILSEAEQLWSDLETNDLGGFSNINRPFWILFAFKQVIEKYGNRDVGLTWSQDDLKAAGVIPSEDTADASRLATATELLADCGRQFRFYENSHWGKATIDGDKKAVVNQGFADRITNFLGYEPDAASPSE